MPTATFNPRTVMLSMLSTANTSISTLATGKTTSGQPDTSKGAGFVTQGPEDAVASVTCRPVYFHTMQANLASLSRHPNMTSQALLFASSTASLFAQCTYQEMLPGGSRGWVVTTDSAALAPPNTNITFDTTNLNQVHYESPNVLWRAGAPVYYAGTMSEVSIPTAIGTQATQAGAGNYIKMQIRANNKINEFRVIYEFYSIAGGASPYGLMTLFINGAEGRLEGFNTRMAVGTAISNTGVLTRRRDFLYHNKAQAINRP